MSVSTGRAAERTGRLRRGVGTTAISRMIGVLAPLFTIPLGLEHLGAEAYGAWSAALALTGFAAFADLGLGAGLMTRLAAALSVGDYLEGRRLVSSAYGVLTLVVVVLIAILWVGAGWIDYGSLVGVRQSSHALSGIVLITLICFLANIVLSLIVRVQYAAQQIARSAVWQASGSVLTVLATVAAVSASVSSPAFVALASAAPLLVYAINTISFFRWGEGRNYRPSPRCFSFATARSLMRLGAAFLIINLLIALSMALDGFIVANTAGLVDAAEYSVPTRIFSMIAVATSVLVGPLWPINVEALRQGDLAWVTHTTRKMSIISGATALILGVIGIVVGPGLISWWTEGVVEPSTILLAGLVAMLSIQAAVSPYFMVQNAASVLLPQMLGYALLLTTLPLKWVVSASVGYDMLPFITVAGFLIFVLPGVIIGYRRAMRETTALLPENT